jgi:hypothetical protein
MLLGIDRIQHKAEHRYGILSRGVYGHAPIKLRHGSEHPGTILEPSWDYHAAQPYSSPAFEHEEHQARPLHDELGHKSVSAFQEMVDRMCAIAHLDLNLNRHSGMHESVLQMLT